MFRCVPCMRASLYACFGRRGAGPRKLNHHLFAGLNVDEIGVRAEPAATSTQTHASSEVVVCFCVVLNDITEAVVLKTTLMLFSWAPDPLNTFTSSGTLSSGSQGSGGRSSTGNDSSKLSLLGRHFLASNFQPILFLFFEFQKQRWMRTVSGNGETTTRCSAHNNNTSTCA